MTHNLTETEPQATCTVPWCVADDFGTHMSRMHQVATLLPGLPRIGVCLIATGSLPPDLFVGPELSVTIAQAARLAALLSRLGHYELAAAITSTADLAQDGAE